MAVWRCTASTTAGWATGASATACASFIQEVSCFGRVCSQGVLPRKGCFGAATCARLIREVSCAWTRWN